MFARESRADGCKNQRGKSSIAETSESKSSRKHDMGRGRGAGDQSTVLLLRDVQNDLL
jgi:hypothetical protein